MCVYYVYILYMYETYVYVCIVHLLEDTIGIDHSCNI